METITHKDQCFPGHDCCGRGRSPVSFSTRSCVEQIDHAGLDAKPSQSMESLNCPKCDVSSLHAFKKNTTRVLLLRAFRPEALKHAVIYPVLGRVHSEKGSGSKNQNQRHDRPHPVLHWIPQTLFRRARPLLLLSAGPTHDGRQSCQLPGGRLSLLPAGPRPGQASATAGIPLAARSQHWIAGVAPAAIGEGHAQGTAMQAEHSTPMAGRTHRRWQFIQVLSSLRQRRRQRRRRRWRQLQCIYWSSRRRRRRLARCFSQ